MIFTFGGRRVLPCFSQSKGNNHSKIKAERKNGGVKFPMGRQTSYNKLGVGKNDEKKGIEREKEKRNGGAGDGGRLSKKSFEIMLGGPRSKCCMGRRSLIIERTLVGELTGETVVEAYDRRMNVGRNWSRENPGGLKEPKKGTKPRQT